MAKTDAKPSADTNTETSPGAAAATQAPPRLGELIHVQVAAGLALVNNETGFDFEPGVSTLQTVTVTTLRRLADGDLVQM